MAWFLVLLLLGREVLLQVNEPLFCLDLALKYFLGKETVRGPVLPRCVSLLLVLGSLREPGSLARVILNETPEKCQFCHSAEVPFEMKL